MRPLRLMLFDPAHPAAARVQARTVEGVHPRCHVYAPLGPGVLAHLSALAGFNTRADAPTRWEVDARAGGDWLARGLREQPGNAALVAGPPVATLPLVRACVEAGLHVLAAAPWAVRPADLSELDAVLRAAELRELVVWPLLPERFDPAVRLLRELATDPDVLGGLPVGTADRPALVLDLHRPLPAAGWGYDRAEAGCALAAAVPLADLLLRLLLPADRPPDPARDVTAVDGVGWPGFVDRDRFAAVTGLADFPPALRPGASGGTLAFPANGTVTCRVAGVAVRLSVLTEAGPAAAGEGVEAAVRGVRATLTARGGAAGEVLADPQPAHAGAVFAALARRCQQLQGAFPGLSVQDLGGRFRLPLPAAPDPHPAALAEFARLFRSPGQVPAWERAAVRTAHHLCVTAAEAARRKQAP